MRFNLLLWVVTMVLALGMIGCNISIGDGIDDDDGSSKEVGISWSWSIIDDATQEPMTCEQAGAVYARVQITDSEDETHDLEWPCSDMSYETDSWDIAPGEGIVTASLLDENKEPLSQTEPFIFEFKSGEMLNEFDLVEFAVDLWDPETGGDSSLTWKWREATADDWDDDPLANSKVFTEAMCAERGIDHVYLWVWNPESQQWWTDTDVTKFRCDAYDHPDDDDIWGSDEYSGVHLNDFLVEGTYEFFLGFYAEEEVTEEEKDRVDLLLYQDSAGSPGDDLDGEMKADDDTTDDPNDATNVYLTMFEKEEETVFGVLKIKLQWRQSEGSTYDTCADSNVKEMGFLLRSDGWVAAEIPLGDGLECLDWLSFEEVPILEEAYELLVSGISKEDDFLWYHLCTDLTPEPDVTIEEANGYDCEIANKLEP
ncbi:MAG: hypothetical protein GY847_40240 [Proteobacteria bacterium]|nr:hypothetical protein [Pseudomonadota bacterium]